MGGLFSMSRWVYTKRFTVRPMHHLSSLKEGLHGHSCQLEISLSKPFDSLKLKTIHSLIVEPLDGRILNDIIPQPTGEEIVAWVCRRLRDSHLAPEFVGLALQETAKNRFEVRQINYLSDSIK